MKEANCSLVRIFPLKMPGFQFCPEIELFCKNNKILVTQGIAKADLSQAKASRYGPDSQSQLLLKAAQKGLTWTRRMFSTCACMFKRHMGIWGYRLLYM